MTPTIGAAAQAALLMGGMVCAGALAQHSAPGGPTTATPAAVATVTTAPPHAPSLSPAPSPAPSPAWGGRAVTLDELFQGALLGNPALKLRELEVERNRAESDVARSRLGPQVMAAASLSLNDLRDRLVGTETYLGRRASMVARQTLYDPASRLRLEAMDASTAQRQLEASQLHTALLGELLDRYLLALGAQDQWLTVQAEAVAAARQVERLRALRERQMARINDLAEAEAYVRALATRAIDARNARAMALGHLHELSGLEVQAVRGLRKEPIALEALQAIRAPGTPGTPGTPGATEMRDVQSLVSQAVAIHPQLLALRQAVEAARRHRLATQAEGRPQVAATFNYVWSDQGYDSRRQPSYRSASAGLELRWPLWDSGRLDASVRENLARQASAEQSLEQAQRVIEREVRTAWLSAQANLDRIEATTAEVRAFEQTVLAQERALELGVARVTDVLDARRRLLAAKADLAKARYDHVRDLSTLRLRTQPVVASELAAWDAWFENPP